MSDGLDRTHSCAVMEDRRKKTMIYDGDPWLLPYRDAIDARHRRILEEKERLSWNSFCSKLLDFYKTI